MCGYSSSGSNISVYIQISPITVIPVDVCIQNIISQFPLKMLKPQYQHLQAEAISTLCQGTQDQEKLLVQVYNININKNGKLTCFLSDGHHCIKAFLKEQSLLSQDKHNNAIILIKQHIVAGSGKSIGVIDFEIICQYKTLIGDPQPISETDLSVHNPEVPANIDPAHINLEHVSMLVGNNKPLTQSSANKAPTSIKKEATPIKMSEKKQMRAPEARPLNGNVKDYQSIKGLFVGLKNWHILCRISRMDYQEFKKKNSDQICRLLTIQLMDRSEVKISGYFFYDAADKFKDYLKLNSVYKISEGSIANESYNNSKNDKLSPFKLMFHVNSLFEEVSDVNIIAKSQDAALPLGALISRQIFDQQFDVMGVLVDIEEPKEIQKDGKTLTRQSWVIADPLEQKKLLAILWNDRIKDDQSLIGQTLLLSRFTLHNYNGSITLNSKARSSIQPAHYTPFEDLKEQALSNHARYQFLSQRKMKEEDNQGTVLKNTRELSAAVEYLTAGETLKTDLDVFVNRLLTKKWFYEGCPGCNKAAQKGINCHCGKYVQQTIPHFIMGVELSDSFGSLYSTAYDEQSKKILWQQEGVIHKMMKYDEHQLKELVEDYYFQEFKVRIYTKRDLEGRIKHNMGKLESIVPEKAAMQNVQRIRGLMEAYGL